MFSGQTLTFIAILTQFSATVFENLRLQDLFCKNNDKRSYDKTWKYKQIKHGNTRKEVKIKRF